MFCVIDIDGTIANNKHRIHFIETPGKPPDWTGFLNPDLVYKDTPVEGAVLGVKNLERLGYELCFLTGRHEGLRDVTMRWLLENFDLNVMESRLLMRPAGNMLNPSEYKREQVIGLLSSLDKSRGIIFLDDDKYAWDMFAEFGIVLRAPECWKTMFPVPLIADGETEELWRK